MTAVLLVTAAGLGFLAFFEPCTIATHTLFAARISHETARRRWLELVELVLSRSALLAAIFGVAAWVGLQGFPTGAAMTMLGVIGAVYVVARRVYLPVPHLEFFHLIPGHGRMPQGLKLGLTLPACTLPLVAVVGVICALTRRPDTAVWAGFLFAGMFSLPTLWYSMREFDGANRKFLSKSAIASPYLTAMLLWFGAFLVWRMGS